MAVLLRSEDITSESVHEEQAHDCDCRWLSQQRQKESIAPVTVPSDGGCAQGKVLREESEQSLKGKRD